MKRKIQAIVIKRIEKDIIIAEQQEIEDNIETYYKLIGCRAIDIVGRYFGGVHFDIVLDDEGLLKANETGELPVSWFQNENYTPKYEGLFGTLVLTHCDNEGNLTSVEPEDIIAVQRSLVIMKDKKGEDLAILFHDVEERN